MGEAAAEAASGGDRALGGGKDVVPAGGGDPARPEGWGAIVCTPGAAPLRALGRALVPQLSGDSEALARLVDIDDPEVAIDLVGGWRKRFGEALLVVDQLEELFTLSPKETQERFAGLLGRLASEADVHVVLGLRDDFLARSQEHPALSPVLAELTVLLPLSAESRHRAVVEPARKRGYRFEDEELVEEVVSAVEGARGALPLLAFAVARLWEKRDREKKLLTREGYREIGGVEGALAQHAEATMDRIGPERQGLVREIFRNLVTARGTRAVIDREELLSVFADRPAAEGVLRQLVDARLLTTYEVEGREGEAGHHRVELVHESLLKAWPRLMRWQAQDEEGALLRDQLKQAAHLWEEKRRTGDLLWTGMAYREFSLWRERYPGTLTAVETDFAKAMTDKARRKRRIVRAAAAAAVLVSTGVAIAIGVSRHKAVVAAERAEASKLLALAQLKLQEDPTEALAFATASLEMGDTKEARVMALRALQEAPPAWEVPSGFSGARKPVFSPDGRRLVVAGHSTEVGVWDENGGPPILLPGHERHLGGGNLAAGRRRSCSWRGPSTPARCTCGRCRQARRSARSTSAGRACGRSVPTGCSLRRRKLLPSSRFPRVACSVPGGCRTASRRCSAGSTPRSSGAPLPSSSPTWLGVALHERDDDEPRPAALGPRSRSGLQPSRGERRVLAATRSRCERPARRVRRDPAPPLPGDGNPQSRRSSRSRARPRQESSPSPPLDGSAISPRRTRSCGCGTREAFRGHGPWSCGARLPGTLPSPTSTPRAGSSSLRRWHEPTDLLVGAGALAECRGRIQGARASPRLQPGRQVAGDDVGRSPHPSLATAGFRP